MKQFRAEIDVSASPSVGWRVLTDFANYSAWNPLLRQIGGEPSLKAALKLRVAQKLGSDKTVLMPARVRVCEPEREIAWGGGVPGLLDVHHYFRLQPMTGGFRFIHGEDFRGFLVPLIWPFVGRRIQQTNYTTLNEAFKIRCENLAAAR